LLDITPLNLVRWGLSRTQPQDSLLCALNRVGCCLGCSRAAVIHTPLCRRLAPMLCAPCTTAAGKQPPSLFALNTSTWQVHEVSGLSALDASWGQPAWTPDGQGLVAVAWPHKALNFPGSARRLGIVHCYNRPCQLYYIPYKAPVPPAAVGSTDGSSSSTAAAAAAADSSSSSSSVTPVKVSGDVQSALSPVFSPAGDQLAFLSQEAAVSSGVHAATSSLYAVQWGGEVSLWFCVWARCACCHRMHCRSLASVCCNICMFCPHINSLPRQLSCMRFPLTNSNATSLPLCLLFHLPLSTPARPAAAPLCDPCPATPSKPRGLPRPLCLLPPRAVLPGLQHPVGHKSVVQHDCDLEG
jgi:hypothetical protein